MTYNEFVAKITVLATANSYIKSNEHGYVFGLNDGHKTYPILLFEPANIKWLNKASNERKVYPVKFYLFALSETMTKSQRDTAWQNQETALDSVIEGIIAEADIVMSVPPTYERYEDEQAAIFNQKCVWIEATFELIIVDC